MTTIPTAAADALAAAEADLVATVDRIAEEERARLMGVSRDDLRAMAEPHFVDSKKATKGDLVVRLARRYAEASGAGQSLAAMRESARREKALIDAIEKAPEAIERAKDEARKAIESGAWGPERLGDAAVAWERAATAARLWGLVAAVAVERGDVQTAVVTVARDAVADLLSTVGSGSGRSTDAVRNIIRDADMRGVYDFLKVAGRHSKEVSAMTRY